jgi:hypothetical protein
MRKLAALLASVYLAAGCTSATSGGNGGPGTGGTAGGGGGQTGTDGGATTRCAPAVVGAGVMGWLDDGASQCADVVVLTDVMGSSNDVLDLVGATPRALSVDIAITSSGPRVGGAYTCGGDGGASVVFVYAGGGNAFTLQSCTITVDQPVGASTDVQGTFSAVLMTAAGLPKLITGGTFDSPVAPHGG